MTAPSGHGRRPVVQNPGWVLAQVIAGRVQRGLDLEYRVEGHRPQGRDTDDRCSDAVYALEDDGLVVLHGDGDVTPTDAGRHQHTVNQAGRGLVGRARTDARLVAGLAIHFQEAR